MAQGKMKLGARKQSGGKMNKMKRSQASKTAKGGKRIIHSKQINASTTKMMKKHTASIHNNIEMLMAAKVLRRGGALGLRDMKSKGKQCNTEENERIKKAKAKRLLKGAPPPKVNTAGASSSARKW